jgi:hypothetical protein
MANNDCLHTDIRFPRKNDILCVFNPISIVGSSYFKYVIWIYLRIYQSTRKKPHSCRKSVINFII